MVPLVEKLYIRNVWRVSWSTKLALNIELLTEDSARDQEFPGCVEEFSKHSNIDVSYSVEGALLRFATAMERQCQKAARTQEHGTHSDGKFKTHGTEDAQVASQAMAVPEKYGPDAERQEVKRDEQEFRTAQQQVKKTTLGRARRERSVIINEYESDKTSRTKQFSQLQTWRNHSLNATRKEVDEKM